MTDTAKFAPREETQKFLLDLAEKNGGLLDPHEVLNAARPVDSPIHENFTWDDGEAAEQFRLYQARKLIRVHVEVIRSPESEVETRVFVSLSSDRKEGGGYRVMAAVLSDKERRQQLLDDALNEFRSIEAKYACIRELAAVMRPMRKWVKNYEEQQMSRAS